MILADVRTNRLQTHRRAANGWFSHLSEGAAPRSCRFLPLSCLARTHQVLLANELGELEMSEVLRKELTKDGVEKQRKLQQLKCNLRVIQLWTEASGSGHLGATYALAMAYLTGWDGAVDEDFDRAEAMATKAAIGGMCKAESVVHMACEMRQKKRRRRAQEIVTLARERRRAGLYVNTLVQGFV